MENNEELVLENTENVEEQATEELVNGSNRGEETVNTTENEVTPTEPTERTYTKAELTEKIDNAVRRREAKLRREYEEKYSRVENVLNAGLGTSNIEEATTKLTDFYKQKGINIPSEPRYSQRDIEVLANAEAKDIISSGLEEVIEEVDRLAEKGLENMTPREKIMFKSLAEHRQRQERINELASIGVKEDVLSSKDFQEYASQFKEDVPISKVYELWNKTQPKPEIEQIGSMKNTAPSKVKDYYTPAEARRLSSKDLDDPNVMAAVEKSMQIWYEKGIQ